MLLGSCYVVLKFMRLNIRQVQICVFVRGRSGPHKTICRHFVEVFGLIRVCSSTAFFPWSGSTLIEDDVHSWIYLANAKHFHSSSLVTPFLPSSRLRPMAVARKKTPNKHLKIYQIAFWNSNMLFIHKYLRNALFFLPPRNAYMQCKQWCHCKNINNKSEMLYIAYIYYIHVLALVYEHSETKKYQYQILYIIIISELMLLNKYKLCLIWSKSIHSCYILFLFCCHIFDLSNM